MLRGEGIQTRRPSEYVFGLDALGLKLQRLALSLDIVAPRVQLGSDGDSGLQTINQLAR